MAQTPTKAKAKLKYKNGDVSSFAVSDGEVKMNRDAVTVGGVLHTQIEHLTVNVESPIEVTLTYNDSNETTFVVRESVEKISDVVYLDDNLHTDVEHLMVEL